MLSDDVSMAAQRDLQQTLQALYDCEINVTISTLWDGGIDFALISYMEFDEAKPEGWHTVKNFAELADVIHERALKEFPAYAEQGRPAA
jgi:hypothetical protein